MLHSDTLCRRMGINADQRFHSASFGYWSATYDPLYDANTNDEDMYSWPGGQNVYWRPGYFSNWSSGRISTTGALVSHEEYHFLGGVHPPNGDFAAPYNMYTRCT